ncbi:hypothetical protein LTS08_000554 [Lithohypha guttulata]|nr:hypothetical protein LTS08_000554 [Lithohypha guttulata]
MAIFKTLLMTVMMVPLVFALPAPQAPGDSAIEQPLHLEVACGCWNLCTLKQLADPALTGCDNTCDPRFACETFNGGASDTATAAASSDSDSASAIAKVKREGLSLSALNGMIETRRDAEPGRPNCVCVVGEGCPCSGGGNFEGNFKEKRSAGASDLAVRDENLAKRFPPTTVTVSCDTSGKCTGSISIHF